MINLSDQKKNKIKKESPFFLYPSTLFLKQVLMYFNLVLLIDILVQIVHKFKLICRHFYSLAHRSRGIYAKVIETRMGGNLFKFQNEITKIK